MLSWWLFPPLDNPHPWLRGHLWACGRGSLSPYCFPGYSLALWRSILLHSVSILLLTHSRVTSQVWSPQHTGQILRFQAPTFYPSFVCFNEKLCLFLDYIMCILEGNTNAVMPMVEASFYPRKHAYKTRTPYVLFCNLVFFTYNKSC